MRGESIRKRGQAALSVVLLPFQSMQRRYITLMELLIVMVILSMIVGVVGINLSSLVRQERFRAGTAFLVDRLQLAQDIMIIFGLDVTVVLEQQPGAVSFHMQVDTGPLGPALSSVTRPITIAGIDTFAFTDSLGASQTGKINLLFMSRGTRMSAGNLMLSSGKPGLTRYIALVGYPKAIKYAPQATKDEIASNLSERLYPLEVAEREQRQNAPE